MITTSKPNRLGSLLVGLGLLTTLALAACGEATSEGNSRGTPPAVADRAGVTIQATASNTGPGGTVTGGGTPNASGPNASVTASGSRGTVGIGSSGAAATAQSDGTRIEGTAGSGARTAGTVSDDGARVSLTPTPGPGASGNNSTTPGPTFAATPTATLTAEGLPTYPGSQEVKLSDPQQLQAIPALNTIRVLMDQPKLTVYKLTNLSDSKRVSDFYRAQLTPQGWVDRTNLLTVIKEFGGAAWYNTVPVLYGKDNQLLFTGISAPLTADDIARTGLGSQFKPGDVAVMTLLGNSKIKLQ